MTPLLQLSFDNQAVMWTAGDTATSALANTSKLSTVCHIILKHVEYDLNMITEFLKSNIWGKKESVWKRGRSRKREKKKQPTALTFFINRWSLSMSLSCCSSFSVRLKSHDVSYTSVSMVTKSSHSSCSPGMCRSFPRRTSDRAQSTWRPQKYKEEDSFTLFYTGVWCNEDVLRGGKKKQNGWSSLH